MRKHKDNVLVRYMRDNNLNISQLAEKVDLPITTVFRHVKNLSNISSKNATIYHEVTGISYKKLLED